MNVSLKRILVICFIIIFLLIVFEFNKLEKTNKSIMYDNEGLDKNKLEKFEEVDIQIEETEFNKSVVDNSEDFIKALKNDDVNIIEITSDIDLGYNLLKEDEIDNNVIVKHNEPLTHPILKQTGVSKLNIKNKDGLIIYSKSGYRILHANFFIEDSKNVKIENLKFEELWEWDESTKAEFDRNDWDYITIFNSENINIKNCEFSKAYDGITDMDNCKNVTIEYCKLNEIDIDKDEFFNIQFEELEENINNYPMYKFLRKTIGLSIKKIKELSSYQFKLYLIGTEPNCKKNENIVIHDNLFLNVKTRVPLARNSSVYLYNNYSDQSKINSKIVSGDELSLIKKKYPKIVSLSTHSVISLEKSYIVLENNIFNGTKHKYESEFEPKELKSGKIVIKSEGNNILELKNMLQETAGVKNINN